MTNGNKLKSIMIEKGITMRELSTMIGISYNSCCKKFRNKSDFKVSEIEAISKILNISDINSIFFAEQVAKLPTRREE